MSHYTGFNKPEHLLSEYLLPLALQFGILAVMILIHGSTVGLGTYIQPCEMVGSEMASPTTGRLIVMIIQFAAGISCTIAACRFAKKGTSYTNDLFSLIFGVFAGMFFWQALGENVWHFSVGGTHFVQLESIAVLPLVIVFIIIYVYLINHHHTHAWGMWCVISSFACNWLGHYIMVGIYPLFADFFDATTWNHTACVIVGAILFAVGIYLGIFASKDRKGRMYASIITYISIGCIALGFLEG